MKPHILLLPFISLAIFCVAPGSVKGQDTDNGKVRTLVIDPGHGGPVPGGVYGGVKEKDIVLKVALLFGKMVTENLPDVKVYYTRETDINIGLRERGQFANKMKADLFISIHADVAADSRNRINTSARGSTNLVMGANDLDRNLDVAMRENEAIIYEENYEQKYEGFNPDSPESYILFSLMQYSNLNRSIEFANILKKHYGTTTTVPNNRVIRQQPLLVLWSTSMPGVLTEIGFLTNTEDRTYMNSAKGQQAIARSLFNAFSEYKSKVEGSTSIVMIKGETVSSDGSSPSETTVRPASATPDNGISFMVQVSASPKKINTQTHNQFRSFRGRVTEKRSGTLYKYYVGNTSSYNEAVKLQAECRKVFKDAFIVAFEGNKQITITDDMKVSNR